MNFVGFSKNTFSFLRNLEKNNNKQWFTDHRDEYDQYYVQPALAFINAIGPKLQKIEPAINFEAKINKSLFRINRDVRFSKDKTPYKTYIDFWFWYGEKKAWDTPSFFMRIQKDTITIGTGIHVFKKTVDQYRNAILDDKRGKELVNLVKNFQSLPNYEVGGATRKQVPSGFAKDHPRSHLLLHNGLIVMHKAGIPKEISSTLFIDYCLYHFNKMVSINNWLLNR